MRIVDIFKSWHLGNRSALVLFSCNNHLALAVPVNGAQAGSGQAPTPAQVCAIEAMVLGGERTGSVLLGGGKESELEAPDAGLGEGSGGVGCATLSGGVVLLVGFVGPGELRLQLGTGFLGRELMDCWDFFFRIGLTYCLDIFSSDLIG